MMFTTLVGLFGLLAFGFVLGCLLSPAGVRQYQVSLMKRVGRAVYGTLGLAFTSCGLCILLAHIEQVGPEFGGNAAWLAGILLGLLELDVLRFIRTQERAGGAR